VAAFCFYDRSIQISGWKTCRKEPKDAWRIFVLADTHNRLPENVEEMAKDADEI